MIEIHADGSELQAVYLKVCFEFCMEPADEIVQGHFFGEEEVLPVIGMLVRDAFSVMLLPLSFAKLHHCAARSSELSNPTTTVLPSRR